MHIFVTGGSRGIGNGLVNEFLKRGVSNKGKKIYRHPDLYYKNPEFGGKHTQPHKKSR